MAAVMKGVERDGGRGTVAATAELGANRGALI